MTEAPTGPAEPSPAQTGTLIIGAGAAGLAVAAQLRARSLPFEIVDAGDEIGASWRDRYDRLRLHTPALTSHLPGRRMPRAWGRYPTRDQLAGYLRDFAVREHLAPHLGEAVQNVVRDGDGWFTTTSRRIWRSHQVVIATGLARSPHRPSWPGLERFSGEVRHSSEYRNGAAWRDRAVLVIGFGNSACEQALDLAEHGAQVHLSVRGGVNVLPRDLFGVLPVLGVGILMRRLPPRLADALAAPLVRISVGDVTSLGLQQLPYGPMTQIARDGHVPLLDVGTLAAIRSGAIQLHGAVDRFTENGAILADGAELPLSAVVLATGYRAGLADFLPDWAQVCDENGVPATSGRPTALPGLYFCGMYVSPAGMLREIGLEAKRIARVIAP